VTRETKVLKVQLEKRAIREIVVILVMAASQEVMVTEDPRVRRVTTIS
jgi:hypothetical protein